AVILALPNQPPPARTATSFSKECRNLSALNPAQPQRPSLLTRNDPFCLQIELHRFCPPPCLCSGRKQIIWQVRRRFVVHLLYREARRPFWKYLQQSPPHGIIHWSVDELHLARMVHIFDFDHLSRHRNLPQFTQQHSSTVISNSKAPEHEAEADEPCR